MLLVMLPVNDRKKDGPVPYLLLLSAFDPNLFVTLFLPIDIIIGLLSFIFFEKS